MQFDTKFLTLLVFFIINFLILFLVKTRTSLVISVIIAHLIAVLFLSVSIANYDAFREITLALIVYSMVILFVISNYGLITVESEKKVKSVRYFLFDAVIYFTAAMVFLLILAVVKEVSGVHERPMVEQERIEAMPTLDSVKKARMHDKLMDNFLLKRSSDVILIIAATSAVLLLLLKKEK